MLGLDLEEERTRVTVGKDGEMSAGWWASMNETKHGVTEEKGVGAVLFALHT